MVARLAHLVVEKDADDGRHHAQDICQGDGVTQHQQRDADDHDSLGGVGDGVAERTDEVEHTESDDVLGEVAEAADEEEQQRGGPSGDVELRGEQSEDFQGYKPDGFAMTDGTVWAYQVAIYEEHREINQNPRREHEDDGVKAQDVEQPQVVDPCVSQHLWRRNELAYTDF